MKSAILIPTLTIFSAIALFVGAFTAANAGHHGCAMFSASISDMDSDDDGVISFKEYSAFHSEQLQWGFNALDTDNDGSISASEWETFLKMHGFGKGYDKRQQG